MAVDHQSFEFIAWLNSNGLADSLKLPRVIAKKDYGWAEFIVAEPCRDQEQVQRFYRRMGAWLAVFYALGATDFHFENLLAANEFPVPVDLETIFHGQFREAKLDSAFDRAKHDHDTSVTSIGILPAPVRFKGKTFDISGVGGQEDMPSLFHVPKLEGVGTDSVRLARVPSTFAQGQNRASVAGVSADIWDYADGFEQGFESTYWFLHAHRERLLKGAFLRLVKKAEGRLVVRPTVTYVPLVVESCHPHVLADSRKRKAVFRDLEVAARYYPKMKPFVASEVRQLEQLDIPAFYAAIGSRDVRGGDGRLMKGVLVRSGWQVARSRIENLGASDFQRQRWFLRASVAAFAHSMKKQARMLTEGPQNGVGYLESSVAIGEMLRQSACEDKKGATWLTMMLSSDENGADGIYQINPVGQSLYDGLAGIILFLAYLDKCSVGDDRYRKLCEKAMVTLDQGLGPQDPLGLFTGVAGRLYLWSHLARLWNAPSIRERANNELAILEQNVDQSANLDVIGGIAGILASSLVCHEALDSQRALELAIHCGDLLAQRQASDGSWKDLGVMRGFSHGLSGIAWALFKLTAVTQRNVYSDVAMKALRRERDALGEKWTDFEATEGGDQATWCHGAPGILMALTEGRKYRQDPWLDAAIDEALRVTLKNSMETNHCLCHGILGNVLIVKSIATSRPVHQKAIESFVGDKLGLVEQQVRSGGFRSATPGRVNVPGLMTGVSGIGLAMLKILNPGVPNVLALDPPAAGFNAGGGIQDAPCGQTT